MPNIDLDLELRDKIIETHTLVARMDKEHDEHKNVVNARLKDIKEQVAKDRQETKEVHAQHAILIDEGRIFRVRMLTYASVAAGAGAFLTEPIINVLKKVIGA